MDIFHLNYFYIFIFQESVQIGSRLGIDYIRSTKEFVTLSICEQPITISQCSIGPLAISFVVWDAGLYLADFLVHDFNQKHIKNSNEDRQSTNFTLGKNVLDLGCGTGIGGICALLTGPEFVLFSDSCSIELAHSNVQELPNEKLYSGKFGLVEYEWSKIFEGQFPLDFRYGSCSSTAVATTTSSGLEPMGNCIWDSVLCSDVLYDSKHHTALLRLLETLSFHQAVFVYKKRHEVEEEAFFESLSAWCDLDVVDPLKKEIPLVNIRQTDLSSLYIVIAKPLRLKPEAPRKGNVDRRTDR